jgi:phosphoserine/homoserine phosphotransferase
MLNHQATLIAADLEGVFLPEVWIAVADATGIERLRLTTRDVADYNELMQQRMAILRENGLTLHDIQRVIADLEPLPGAVDFMDWVRTQSRLVVLTDSFYQFLEPFMPKLHYPTIFAHQLVTDRDNMIVDFTLRVSDSKRVAMESFRTLGFRTMAFGDSFNDTTMLKAADVGVFFRPPKGIAAQFPDFAVTHTYPDLVGQIEAFLTQSHGAIAQA